MLETRASDFDDGDRGVEAQSRSREDVSGDILQ